MLRGNSRFIGSLMDITGKRYSYSAIASAIARYVEFLFVVQGQRIRSNTNNDGHDANDVLCFRSKIITYFFLMMIGRYRTGQRHT